MSICQFPLCKRIAESNGMCFLHRVYATGETRRKERVTVVKEVKKISEKRAEEEKLYKKIVQEKFKESNLCEISSSVCTKIATGLHHQKKRAGKFFLDIRYLKRACDPCNNWCEQHPFEAIKLGMSLSKFS